MTFRSVDEVMDDKVSWLNIGKNEAVDVIILSAVSPKNVGTDSFELGKDVTGFGSMNPYIEGGLKSNDGEAVYFKLPVLTREGFDPENNKNPFVYIPELLGVEEWVKGTYLMWVAEFDVNSDEIVPKVYQAPYSVVKTLKEIETANGDLRGRICRISRSDKGFTKYTVQPLLMDAVDVSGVEFPTDLRHLVYPSTIDEQIVYINRVKDSLMRHLGMTEDEYPFTDDNLVKEEFLTDNNLEL